MYSNDKIPPDKESQKKLLSEISRAFLDRDFTKYYAFLSESLLNLKNISECPDFYINLSKTLSRHVRIVPELADARHEFRDIASEMASSGASGLKEFGERFFKICETVSSAKAENAVPGPSSIVSYPEFQNDSAVEFFKKYSGGLKELLLEELETGWKFSGDIDRNLAFLCELFSAGDDSADGYAEKWFNAKVGVSYITTVFFEDLCELLRIKGESGWLITLGEAAIPFINDSPAVCSVLAEAHFMLSSFERSIELINAAEESVSITPYLKHLKSYALWRTGRPRAALELIEKRLSNDPSDTPAALLAGDILLESSRLEAALKAYSYAYAIEPGSADVIFGLARAYRECYFFDQVDICLHKLRSIAGTGISKYGLGVELYVKCDREGARAFIDGVEIGPCPVLLKRAAAGRRDIKWIFADGSETGLVVDLKDGYIHKFKYISKENTVDSETSREGHMTVYRSGKAVPLSDLLKAFRVGCLEDIPKVGCADFTGEEVFEGLIDPA